MTVQNMDICINVSAEPTFPSRPKKNTQESTESVGNSIKRAKKSVLGKSIKNDKQISKALNSSAVNTQKRVKQKSLAAIFAKKLNGNVHQQQTTANQEKHQSKDSTSKLLLSNSADKCLSDKQKTIQSNNIVSNQHESTGNDSIISFTKTNPKSIGKTILAKKRNINDISEKKSLADIFSKSTEIKAKETNLLNFSQKSDDSHTISKKPKLDETLKSKNKQAFKASKSNDLKHSKHKGKFEKKLNDGKSEEQSSKVFHRHTGKISSLFGNNPEVPNIGQRLIKPVNETVFSGTLFSDLDIHPFMVANLKQNMNITKMTTVQQKAIPQIFLRKDILIRSQTGSGKTMTYALPIVEFLHKIRPQLMRSDGTKALVVVPTRELALQTYECFLKLVKPFTWIVPGYLVGGEKRKAEKARLRKGCTILIATPGRLLDHVKHTEALRLNDIKYFVLDEADRMLDMGYERDISEIVNALTTSNSTDNNSGYNPMQLLRQNSKKVFSDEEIEDEEKTLNECKSSKLSGEGNSKKKKQYHSDSESDLEDNIMPINNKKAKGNRSTETQVVQNSVKPQEETQLDSLNSSRRQTILLSATLTQAVEKLAGLTMENPIFVDAAKENLEMVGGDMSELNEDLVVPQSVVQTYIVVPPKLRMVTLSAYIAGKCQRSGQHKIIIFMATQDMVDYHAEILSSVLNKPIDEEDEDSDPLVDVDFFQLHGNMTQKERTDVFKTFRLAKTGVLLCTDVAARGLDLPKVDSVIQYTGPISARDYVHRIGRTARAGSSGYATIFLTPPEVEFVRILESRRIRIKQENMEDVLDHLLGPLSKHNTPHSAAIALQNDFETLILESKKLRGKAYKAYTSWLRFYSSYPREMREVFNRKELHLGHYAKSFGLRDPPQRIGGFAKKLVDNESKPQHKNRLNNDRTNSTQQQQRPKKGQDGGERAGSLKKVRMLNISEYGSGLEPIKKQKKS